MTNNPEQPREYDAVLGGNNLPPATDAVLGGIEGVKYRLASDNIGLKVAALSDAMKYEDAGLDLVIAALKDKSQEIQQAACKLLQDRPEKKVKNALQYYDPWLFLSCLRTIKSHLSGINCFAISPDGKTIFMGGDFTIAIWDLETETLKYTDRFNKNGFFSLSISHDGKTLASVGARQEIKIWDVKLEKIKLRFKLKPEKYARIEFIALSADGQTLFIGSHYDGIQIWDLKTEDCRDIQIKNLGTRECSSDQEDVSVGMFFAISSDRQTLASGRYTINIWDAATRNLIHTLQSPLGVVLSLAISSDRKILVIANLDSTIDIWDVATGNLKHTLKGHSEFITSLVITPDGRSIISGSFDTTIRIWDVNTGKLKRSLEGHLDGVKSIAISPDGRTIISGSYDRTIKIWGIPEV